MKDIVTYINEGGYNKLSTEKLKREVKKWANEHKNDPETKELLRQTLNGDNHDLSLNCVRDIEFKFDDKHHVEIWDDDYKLVEKLLIDYLK